MLVRRLAIAAIVALVILDIFLIPRALERGRGDATDATQQTTGVGSAGTSDAATTPDAEPTPPPASNTADTVLTDGPTLMALDGDVVVEAERGSCAADGPAGVVVSRDDAQTFTPVTFDTPLVAVLALQVDAGVVEVTGADADCTLVTLESSDDGSSWAPVESAPLWRLVGDPAEEQVESPEGRMATPCRPLALSSEGGAVVRLLCADGSLLGVDEGAWAALGELPGATAVRYPTPARGFAIAPGAQCPTAVFGTRDGGTDWTELACLEGADRPGAVAGRDGHYVARAGGVSLVSTDGGETWSRP